MSTISSSSECQRVDDSFGPYALKCRGGFDFTLLFEESVLTILPLAVLFACTSFRIFFLLKKNDKVIKSRLANLKLISYACFAILQVVLLVLWSLPSTAKTRLSVAASALTLFAIFPLAVLSYLEHKNTLRPSTILSLYLFISTLFDAAHVRTLWLRHENRIAAFSTVSLAFKIIIFTLESVNKRQSLKPEFSICSPEATSGFLNRTLFWWLNPLFLHGYKSLLFLHDLCNLDKHLTTSYLSQIFEASWTKAPKSSSQLFTTLLRAYKAPIIYGILPRIILIALNFTQPFLINRAVNLSMQEINSGSTNAGYGMIGAYALVYIGIALATGQYQHQTYRAITMIRGGLVSKIFEKTNQLSLGSVEAEATMVLMNTDIENISQGLQMAHDIWANLIEIGLATYLLHRQLGAPSGIPLGVVVLSIFIAGSVSGFIMGKQKLWLEAIEKRIAISTKMLGSMKEVKLTGLSDTLLTRIHGLRIAELQISKGFRKLLIWALSLTYITPVFAPILTFAVFAILSRSKGGDGVNTAQVFTSLSLFVLLSTPLGTFIQALTSFMGAIGCFSRIQTYLNTTPRVDTRVRPSNPKSVSAVSSEKAESLKTDKVSDEKSGTQLHTPGEEEELPEDIVIDIQNGAFAWKRLPVPLPESSEADAEAEVEVSPQAGSKKTKKTKKSKNDKSKSQLKPEEEVQGEADLILQDINLSVQREKITAIIGPVGSGKSTLMKALLGEVPISQGTVRIASDDFAFCEQTPWLTNGTIQHIILGNSLFEQEFYETVIRACALEEDFKLLPRGDQTLVGSKGITLSGGQAQRISLARAVYSKRKILLLDDIFRGLDSHTEDEVFHNLLGTSGLLRHNGSTVVLVTSTAMRISYVDHIIALDKTGRISEQGSFQTLESVPGSYVAGLSVLTANWDTALDDEPNAVRTNYVYHPPGQNLFEDTSAAEASRRTGDVEIYTYYFKSIGRLPSILFVIMLSIFVFAFSFPNIWLKWWATANSKHPNERLGYYLGIYTLFGVAAIFFLMVSCWLVIITMVPKSGEFFHLILLKRIMVAPISFFANTDTGVTLNRLSQDLQLIDMDLPVSALNASAAFMFCIAQLILIAVTSKFAAIAFPFCFVAFYLIQRFYLRTSRQLRFMDIEAKAPLFSQFVESLSGLATIRAFGWQSTLEEKNSELLDVSQKPFYLLWAVQRWLTVVLDLVIAAIAVLLMILVVKLRGTISAGYVGVSLVNVLLFSQSIKLLITFWTTLEVHIGAIARIKNFEGLTPTENKDSENNEPPPSWPMRGAIEFRDISASYRKSEPVLRNVSFDIKPGQKVAICGRTGSGKSSLILSLFRMMEEFSGQIIIDGIDISSIPRQEIRSKIICISQEPFLFTASVRTNADPSESASDPAIMEALEKVHLWEVIEKKGGLDAELNDTFLSHGQKQLFCLARAMLRKSTILVLDEATSSVDKVTEEVMQSVLDVEFQNCTILSIGHKLDNVINYDKVAFLSAGVLVEFDSPKALLADQRSNFSQLYQRFGKAKVEHKSGENTES